MDKKQIEKQILELSTIRDNVQANIDACEWELDEATSYIDNAINELCIAKDSLYDLTEYIGKLEEKLKDE
tara:strand:+ start:169 stop:378 length:210 start_codon:yes stop_codon:yes gene_type:complete